MFLISMQGLRQLRQDGKLGENVDSMASSGAVGERTIRNGRGNMKKKTIPFIGVWLSVWTFSRVVW
jgi:hypothetical protein